MGGRGYIIFIREAVESLRDLSVNDRLVAQAFGLLRNTAAGQAVDEDTAMTMTAIYSATKVIAESIASLPLKVYRRTDDGKTEARSHPLWSLLHDQPNPTWDSYKFREFGQANLLLRGNMFAQIVYDGANRPRELWPIASKWVEVINRGRRQDFRVRVPETKSVTGEEIDTVLPGEEMLFIPGISFNGIEGISPISAGRDAVGIGLAAEEFAGNFLANDATPSGALVHPESLGEEAIKRLRRDWQQTHGGSKNSGKTAILEEGMEYEQIGMSPEDSQLVETRQFQVREVARLFGIPPHMIQDLQDATFSNIETQSLEFVTYTLRPWLTRWEQAINSQLVPDNAAGEVFVEFNVEGLLRADSESRAEFYSMAIQNGWMSPNEVRKKENMNPIPGGDRHFVQLNLMEISDGEQPQSQPLEGGQSEGQDRFKYELGPHTVNFRERYGLIHTIEDGGDADERRAIGLVAARKAAEEVMGSVDKDDFLRWFEGYEDAYQEREGQYSDKYEARRLVNACSWWAFRQNDVDETRISSPTPGSPCHTPDESRDMKHPPYDDGCSCIIIPA